MLVLSTWDDQAFRDPSPEVVRGVIESLPPGGDSFVILGREGDEQTYIQAIGSPSEGFTLEYQDGSVDRHFECATEDLTAEHIVLAFQAYLRGDAVWKTAFAWQRVEL